MKKIFVTGGTGFLGRHLIPMLCQAGYHLCVLTRQPQQHSWLQQYPYVDIITGDIRTGAGLAALTDCDFVIHAAGLFSMWRMAGDFMATNVHGTENLLEQAARTKIERFIYISTIAVIGDPQPNQIIDEAHPPRPADPYQASKLHAEQWVKHYHDHHQLETIILRPGAFYGPLGNYAFNRLFFTDPMRGITMQMDGGHYLIFPVYVSDVADAIVLALNTGTSGAIYNICDQPISHQAAFDIIYEEANLWIPRLNIPGGIGMTVARVLTWLAHFTGREPFYPLSMRSYVFNNWHVTSRKAQTELGFTPTPFRIGAQRTIAWYRAGKPDTVSELGI